ncbi:MAG: peptidylprolyl isomerase [Zoogloea sp.]|uniref:peptidylprolyl isomerase n=1 Tax=Zoogloea sp. TaxID=49181 RepID=UPI002608BE23|nr:peptidylprolyl isomerase [Zoogloea sp.]MDD2987863.1 peptidylprolyl isomerase [Zoogloea sp.]
MRFQNFFLSLLLAAAPCLAEDKVLMKHEGTVLRQGDLTRAVSTFVPPDQIGAFYADEKKVRDTIVRVFIQRKLAEEAAARKLSSEERATIEDAKLRAQSQVQIEYLINKRTQPDFGSAALEAYKANKEKYTTPERVQVEHILIDMKSRTEEAALARANEIRALVLKGDRKFSDIAREYSDDSSVSRNGGDLGLFAKGAMVKPFEDAAFAMKNVGDVSEPISTKFGFHILRYLGREPSGYTPFEKVKEGLEKEEKSKFRSRVLNEEFERVSKVNGVQVDQDAIKELLKPVVGAAKR